MTDTPDPIPPALTPEEWKAGAFELGPNWWDGTVSGGDGEVEIESGTDSQEGAGPIKRARLASLIALANAALPDDDPRKITREKVDRLKSLIQPCEDDEQAFLDALASYLPPETP